jgi:hypothetical protein
MAGLGLFCAPTEETARLAGLYQRTVGDECDACPASPRFEPAIGQSPGPALGDRRRSLAGPDAVRGYARRSVR